MTTFDELAISATASGKVSAWAALIDEAIELDKLDYVWELWLTEQKLGINGLAVHALIEKHLPWCELWRINNYTRCISARDYAHAVVFGDAIRAKS